MAEINLKKLIFQFGLQSSFCLGDRGMPITTADPVETAVLNSDFTQVALAPMTADQACICNICSKSVGSNRFVTSVKCVASGGRCHVVYIVNKFAACYGSALKNSL